MDPVEEARGKKEFPTYPSDVLISSELFAGKREILIRHNKDCYRLMITKAGKLVLNK